MRGQHQAPETMKHETATMMAEHHKMALWTTIPLLMLGMWLIASPFTLGYQSAALTVSDIVSGLVVMGLAWVGFGPRKAWAPWVNCLVGLWLMAAPLVFWAPTAGEYANDTIVGALAIAFTILISHSMPMPGPDVPPDWSYNPSTWQQRLPILTLGFVSFLMARFQLGHIDTVWEPFFGDGTRRILTSDVSKAWPVSDAGLGALGLASLALRWRRS